MKDDDNGQRKRRMVDGILRLKPQLAKDKS